MEDTIIQYKWNIITHPEYLFLPTYFSVVVIFSPLGSLMKHIFSYFWTILCLSRAVVPLIQGFEDAGDFTTTARLKTSVHVNLVFYLIVGFIGLCGLILLITMDTDWFVLHLCKIVVSASLAVELFFSFCRDGYGQEEKWRCSGFCHGVLKYFWTCYGRFSSWLWFEWNSQEHLEKCWLDYPAESSFP